MSNNDNPNARVFFSRLASLSGDIEQQQYLGIAQSVGLDQGVPLLTHTDYMRLEKTKTDNEASINTLLVVQGENKTLNE